MNPPETPTLHRILVVDDNPSIHDDFRKILCPATSPQRSSVDSMAEELFGELPSEKLGGRFEMDSAFQGQEALAKVQAAEQAGRPYSLAFMDVRMPPGWDGVETIEHIWKQYPHVQIVICTAYSDYSWEQILRRLGESDSLVILKKPFDNVEVLQLAHALTKKWLVTREASARMADLDERVRQRTEELLAANRNLQSEIQRRSITEGALRESEERFHKAFETAAVALALRPLDAPHYVDANQSFVTLSGYTKQELLSARKGECNLLLAAPFAEWVQALRAGKRVNNQALEIRRKDGQLRQTMTSLELLKLGEQACLLMAFVDVTEQRQLETQLRQAQKMEAVGQLAAGIAHDFNNILTVIHGYASLQLARNRLEADVAKAFAQVKLASERAANLTRQLLAFSRKQVMKCRPIRVDSAIARARDMLGRVLGETIRFECTCPPDLPLIRADESHLDQVIMNLAVNARDAMPNGGTFHLTAEPINITRPLLEVHPERREGSFVRLSFSDTGCGMNPETLSRIFEPFFTTKPVGKGTGLGLSTVYGIVKQHEGWIEVASHPGKGSTFSVYFAVTQDAPEPPAAMGPGAASELPTMAQGESILVVEDQDEVRGFMALALKEKGYHVLDCESGAEALLRWKQFPTKVRLLITDMVMPEGVSGSVLAHQLLRREPALKVIFTSGYSPDAGASAGPLKEGVNFISKPFTQEALLRAVEAALSSGPPRSGVSSPSVG